MNRGKVKYYFFLGIGGIGMSALARFLNTLGYNILGYDAVRSDITQTLEKAGIKIFYKDDPSLLPGGINASNTVVVLTPAIKQGKLLDFFHKNGFEIVKRAKLLGQIANQHPLIAIAGTHGKTSTTAIVSHILHGAQKLKAGFVGGVVKNYNSNLILPGTQPDNGYIVVEADEYDRSFLQLKPDIAIVTSIDPDHLDIYSDLRDITHTFEQFLRGTRQNAQIIINDSLTLATPKHAQVYSYGLKRESDFHATDIKIKDGKQYFTLHLLDRQIPTFILFPGQAYLQNSIAAAAAAFLAGVQPEIIAQGLQAYQGTKRRFELRFASDGKYIYDDYAHHPNEIKALHESIRQFFPDKKITIVFQPHLFSRTRDFASEFARALDLFDRIIITDIYPAREDPIPGVSPNTILDRMTNPGKMYIPKSELINHLYNSDFQVLLVVGAGDANQIIEPLTKKLEQA